MTPAQSIQRILPLSMPRSVKYAARVISSTSRASGLLKRNISTATGVIASTPPASSAAPGEKCRRTMT